MINIVRSSVVSRSVKWMSAHAVLQNTCACQLHANTTRHAFLDSPEDFLIAAADDVFEQVKETFSFSGK